MSNMQSLAPAPAIVSVPSPSPAPAPPARGATVVPTEPAMLTRGDDTHKTDAATIANFFTAAEAKLKAQAISERQLYTQKHGRTFD